MTSTQIMEAEHRLIETVVKALGGAAAGIAKGQHPDCHLLITAAEFLRTYADQLHHGKEEALFFPMLIKRGVPPQGCPIGGLNHEHEKGRVLVKALADQASACQQGAFPAQQELLATLRALFDLYQNHIWKEDAMVFPMADKVLTAADQRELAAKFAEVDRSIGLDVLARWEQFARSLTPTARAPLPAAPSAGGCDCGCKA